MDCDMDTLEGNDEHPMKFQRMGNRNSPINPTGNPPVDIVSPIGHGTPSVVNYDTKLHANPSDDATRDQENSVKNTIRASATPNPEAGLSSGITGDAYVVSLLVTLASAYQLLSSYQCRKCVNLLHKLPKKHFSTGWTQQILGKAYCEMNEYKNALLSLREMLRIEPFRVKGTETLSTALWHLKKDKELCALAQQIVEVDKYAPETWCVVGNCFSLQREPDAAIRFFQRALQIDPTNFPYAHTLCGHEYVNNEDLEKAINSFRNALLLDDRHYNAWYGLGSIYYRQEKYELAEYHFRRALSINSSSSVLQCYLAMVLHAQGSTVKSQCALEILTKATEHDRNNPQLRFQKAYIYMALEQLDDALVELEIVREQAPREAPVYAMLGQLYQQLGRKEDALRAINSAIDLDPKESMSLKSLLERMANDI
jgi:anaphase-promoting complex subunit 3